MKQALRSGWSNSKNHLFLQHPGWEDVASSSSQRGIGSFFSKKSYQMTSWIELVVETNLPFSDVEKEVLRKHVKIECISTDTLVR